MYKADAPESEISSQYGESNSYCKHKVALVDDVRRASTERALVSRILRTCNATSLSFENQQLIFDLKKLLKALLRVRYG